MTFLPKADRDYLQTKGIDFELRVERIPDGSERKGVVFPQFDFEGELYSIVDGKPLKVAQCMLLILIPSGYATTKLDSFYSSPGLRRADGGMPAQAASEQELFGVRWQFWSRHLEDKEWRVGVDGLETYLQYVRAALRVA